MADRQVRFGILYKPDEGLHKRQLQNKVGLIRLLYYLPMEMTNRPIIENGMKYFKCKKCGEVKPLNKSYFYINMNTRLGFISKCISCVREEVANKPKVKYITRAELEEENKKLKEKIKEHQLYEEKLEHRIIEFEELLHGE